MKGRTNRQEQRAKKRASKEAGMKNPAGTKSKYALKIAAKRGRGRVRPEWMWWYDREAA